MLFYINVELRGLKLETIFLRMYVLLATTIFLKLSLSVLLKLLH